MVANLSEMLSPQDVTRELDISAVRLWQLRKAGTLRGVQTRLGTLYTREEVDAFRATWNRRRGRSVDNREPVPA